MEAWDSQERSEVAGDTGGFKTLSAKGDRFDSCTTQIRYTSAILKRYEFSQNTMYVEPAGDGKWLRSTPDRDDRFDSCNVHEELSVLVYGALCGHVDTPRSWFDSNTLRIRLYSITVSAGAC